MGYDTQEALNKYGGKVHRAEAFRIKVKGLEQFERNMDSLASTVQRAVRPAAQAGAQVLVDEVRKNVRSMLGRGSYLAPMRGILLDSVYQVYSRNKSGVMNAEYHVSWNHKVAPHAHLVENGHVMPYKAYIGKDGLFHTAVRPERLQEYIVKYKGRTVPKSLRPYFFVPHPGGPKQIAARPFVRAAQARFEDAGKKVAETLNRALDQLELFQ